MLVVSAREFKIMRYAFLFLVALVASSYVSARINAGSAERSRAPQHVPAAVPDQAASTGSTVR